MKRAYYLVEKIIDHEKILTICLRILMATIKPFVSGRK